MYDSATGSLSSAKMAVGTAFAARSCIVAILAADLHTSPARARETGRRARRVRRATRRDGEPRATLRGGFDVTRDSMGGSILIAAAMLRVSIIGSSSFLAQAVERGATRLRVVVAALRGGSALDRARTQPARRGDPPQRDEVAVEDVCRGRSTRSVVTVAEGAGFRSGFSGRVANPCPPARRALRGWRPGCVRVLRGDRRRGAHQGLPGAILPPCPTRCPFEPSSSTCSTPSSIC